MQRFRSHVVAVEWNQSEVAPTSVVEQSDDTAGTRLVNSGFRWHALQLVQLADSNGVGIFRTQAQSPSATTNTAEVVKNGMYDPKSRLA